jgi:hypothetical protein
MRELSEKKLKKALRYKELLEKAEEAKKRGEKRKFSKECGVFDFFAQPAEAEVRPGRFFRADRQAKRKSKQEQ